MIILKNLQANEALKIKIPQGLYEVSLMMGTKELESRHFIAVTESDLAKGHDKSLDEYDQAYKYFHCLCNKADKVKGRVVMTVIDEKNLLPITLHTYLWETGRLN